MPVSVRDKLGPYEVISAIGKGGMGEVFRARDPRLNRDVAIKTSLVGFSGRFQKEAQAIAALNHPNICTLYDVGPDYLVMEYIEGPTLADRMKQGPVPLEEALRIAAQIAAALEAAHEKFIVHRDLKPANIKLRADGSVKVLDFGLARTGEPTEDPAGNSPTLLSMPTDAGMILGTAGYMSPEQARGEKVDKRADIFAFGVVLYEMVTGKRLFDGRTVSDCLAAVLTKEPDLGAVPMKVRRLLRRCLEKDKKRRLRDIGEYSAWLEENPVTTAAPLRWWFGYPWMVAAVVLAIVAVAGWYRATRPAALRPLVRLDVDLGADVSLSSQRGADVIVSPDGTRLAYVSNGKLSLRRLDQPGSTEMPGTDGASSPFFSPDGHWVAFFAGGKLKKTSVEGGTPVMLCDLTVARGGSWSTDGNTIIFSGRRLAMVSAAGGGPVACNSIGTGRSKSALAANPARR